MSAPWYRRFPDNFLGGTNGLTLEEKGAYSIVIDMIYQRGGPIMDEPRYIAGVCNCSVRKWNAIRDRLLKLGKLEMVDGHLTNERAEIELEKAAKAARERAENGAKGGVKSAQKRSGASKNNGLGQGSLKHTRASPLLNSVYKGENASPGPTDGVVLDRYRVDHEGLFKTCEEITGKPVPDYMQRFSFPASVVAEARKRLAH